MTKSGASRNAKPIEKTGDLAQGPNFTPKYVRDANKRLSGPGPFSTEDKKTVAKYYKGLA